MSSSTNIHLDGDGAHHVRDFGDFTAVQVSRDPACDFSVFVETVEQADALIAAFQQAKTYRQIAAGGQS